MKQRTETQLSERDWDRKLNIHTTGRDESGSDEQNFPYEPTPYTILERLAASGYISSDNYVLDYGCGKGRVCFFLSAVCGCMATGIDLSEKLLSTAESNRRQFQKRNLVRFQKCMAEHFEVTAEDTFFFFNPFKDVVLRSVLGQIRKSWLETPRPLQIFCYYPSDEFVTCLMTAPDLLFEDEIDCRDLFPGNNDRERILVFRMDAI